MPQTDKNLPQRPFIGQFLKMTTFCIAFYERVVKEWGNSRVRAEDQEEVFPPLYKISLNFYHSRIIFCICQDSPVFKRPGTVCLKTPVKIPMEVFTSTPAPSSSTPSHSTRRGKFRHATSRHPSVLYPTTKAFLATGSFLVADKTFFDQIRFLHVAIERI